MINPTKPLTHYNRKYGTGIYNFSLPRETCLFKTKACEEWCYGKTYAFLWPDVKNRYADNWKDTRDPGFVDAVINQIRRKHVKWVRVHTIGDYYSQEYLNKWLAIARECPECHFMSYTRNPTLDFSEAPKNFRFYYSVDDTTLYFNPTINQLAILFDPPSCRIKYDHMEPLGYPNNGPPNTFVCSYICDRCKACWLGNFNIGFPAVKGQKSYKPDWIKIPRNVSGLKKIQKTRNL